MDENDDHIWLAPAAHGSRASRGANVRVARQATPVARPSKLNRILAGTLIAIGFVFTLAVEIWGDAIVSAAYIP